MGTENSGHQLYERYLSITSPISNMLAGIEYDLGTGAGDFQVSAADELLNLQLDTYTKTQY